MARNAALDVLVIGGVGVLLYLLFGPSEANASGVSAITDPGSLGNSPQGVTDFSSALGSVVSASKFTLQDIENLWVSNGGDPSKASQAAAIALAESGGNPEAYNGADPHGGSFGLFQINGVHGDLASYDPIANVKAAIQISNNGQNWNPWGAFTNGSWLKFFTGGAS